ncbi:ATP-binding protein [Isoptericola sp. NPDC056578]|uniref:sensor histidine kinase n=1 Tax=Isoptericola sp. NPDC056578 TaxID=3345870 RepID=UPI003683C0E3
MSVDAPLGRFAPVRAAWARIDTVLKRQVVFGVLYAVSLALVPLAGVPVASGWFIVAGALVELLVLAAAAFAPWHRWPPAAQDVLPIVSALAIVLLERGTSFTAIYFTSLVLLPVVSLAWNGGWRGIVLATITASAVVAAPRLWHGHVVDQQSSIVRAVLIPLISLALASFVAAAAQGQRSRNARLQELTGQLRTSRDLMAGLVDAATEQAIVATDVQGRIEVFNQGAERLTGWAAGEAVGHSILELRLPTELDVAAAEAGLRPMPDEDPASVRLQGLLGAAMDGGVQVRDWTLLRRGESAGTVRVTVTRRLPQPSVRHTGYLFVSTDITEQLEAERAKDQFLGYVSHELRTPISSLLGYLELLGLDDGNLTDEQRDYLAVVERNARRLLRLVEDLLLTAQVDAGRFTVAPEPTDLRTITAGALRTAAPQARAAGVDLVDGTEAEVPLDGDATRLGQMVDNLVSNALKFTPRGGTVTVRAAPGTDEDGGPAAVLTVQDTGVGIPGDEVRRLTDRFFRASTATERRIPGVGLGLSISKAIIDAHGGTLTIASVVGEGTTFTVRLPGSAWGEGETAG